MKSNELYNIIIQEGEIFTGLSEDEFLDKMVELSQCYYETGYPSPDIISHTTYNGEDVHESHRDNDSNDSKED
jgi:hypothetical protein|tara:strand:+ start:32 stop:250 length:219 start_codon:yes stop_codon:yes gene_type:complete